MRCWPAGRGRLSRRKPQPQDELLRPEFTLTAPTTITIIITTETPMSTMGVSSTEMGTTVMTTMTTMIPSVTSSVALPPPTTSSSLPPASSSSSVTSSFTTSLLTSIPPTPTVIISGDGSATSSVAPAPNTGALATGNAIPAGGVVGIVIAGVLLLLAATVLLVRRRYMRNRQRKRASAWLTAGGTTGISGPMRGEPAEVLPTSFTDTRPPPQPYGSGFGAERAPNSMAAMGSTPVSVPPPPSSYNNPYSAPVAPSSAALTASMYTNAGAIPSGASVAGGETARVKYTFVPSLPDELPISNGETIRVVLEYDDGWALCSNARGQEGMVPLECLDRGRPGDDDGLGPGAGTSRRTSSIQ